jgi:hypothetical protein
MAGYSAIGNEPPDIDAMTSSTGSLRGRRLDIQASYCAISLTKVDVGEERKMQGIMVKQRGYQVSSTWSIPVRYQTPLTAPNKQLMPG